jgi:HEAT repeat protein
LAKAAPPEESVPLLIAVLKRRSRASRTAAALGLAELGPASHAAIPALVATLKEFTAAEGDTVSGYGAQVAQALGRIAPQAPEAQASSEEVIAVLTEVLNVRAVSTRSAAAQALRNFGPKATRAIPRLRELLDDQTAIVRDAAKSALEKIEPQSKPTSAPFATGKGT